MTPIKQIVYSFLDGFVHSAHIIFLITCLLYTDT